MNITNNKKKIMAIVVFFILAITGCSTLKREEAVSDKARTVIETMMTCPNSNLYRLDMQYTSDEYNALSKTEKERIQSFMDDAYRNWEAAVGDCFGYGYLSRFIYEGPALQYLVDSERKGISISVEQMTLEEKTEAKEIILVTIIADEAEQQVTFTIRYDTQGLIKTVEVKDDND